MNTGWWVADVLHGAGPFMLLSWIFWVIFSITLHELGHGWAALRVGDDTPLRTGHMSMNPLVHMGTTSLIVFAVAGIAWGAMPVNPSRFRGKHADAFVAFAGPMVNLGLWTLCVVLSPVASAYLPDSLAAKENVVQFLSTGAWLNSVLFVLNLLPVPPLDGSRIVASFSMAYRRLIEGPRAPMIALVGILFIFIVADDFIFGVSATVTGLAMGVISVLLH